MYQENCTQGSAHNWKFAAAPRFARLARRAWAATVEKCPDVTCVHSIAASVRSPLSRTGTSAHANVIRYVKTPRRHVLSAYSGDGA